MKFQELNKGVKYCSNQITTHKSVKPILPRHTNKDYITNLEPQFRDEVELFNAIIKGIEEMTYQE